MTVRFFDEKGEKSSEKTRDGFKLEKDVNRTPSVDVLRERTAALNLRGGSRSRSSSFQTGFQTGFVAPSGVAGRARAEKDARAREKDEGNEHFRRGRYADAFASYTRAIESTRDDINNGADGADGGADTGRDVAVCYANRAATRLMLAQESTARDGHPNGRPNGHKDKDKEAKNSRPAARLAAAETMLALADCRAALRADASFTRARLRAGTCLVRLGAFAAAEAEFTLVVRGGPGERTHTSDTESATAREAAELAGEASRARRAVDALRVETLPSLRRNAIRGVAEGAETARKTVIKTVAGLKQNGEVKNGAGLGGFDSSVRRLAERTAAVVAPLRRLAPHCAVVAEAHARASLCVGAFAEATRAADEDGFGGAIEGAGSSFDEDAPSSFDDTASPGAPTVGSDVAGSNPASGAKTTKIDGWRRVVRALAHFARGNPGGCVDELAGLRSPRLEKNANANANAERGVRSGDVHDEETTALAALRRVAAAQDDAKRAGNDAFRAGRFDDAEARYAEAVDAAFPRDVSDLKTGKKGGFDAASNGTPDDDARDDVGCIGAASVCFAAICLCNSAAAAQGAGNLLDAIAFCGQSLALNPARGKSLLRRAQVLKSLRLGADAADDYRALRRLLEAAPGVGVGAASGVRGSDSLSDAGAGVDPATQLAPVRAALEELTRLAPAGNRTDDPGLDHYAALGLVPPGDVPDRHERARRVRPEDVRRAYRALALRHHPDKALKSYKKMWPGLDSNPGAHDALRADADRIFKLLGEANARLSDPTARAAYDADELARHARRGGSCRRGRNTYSTWTGGGGDDSAAERERTRRGGSGFESRAGPRGAGAGAGGWGGRAHGGGSRSTGGEDSGAFGWRGGKGRERRGGRRWDGFGASHGF